jgi:hypothetical protein
MVLPPFRRNRSRLRNFALGDEYIILYLKIAGRLIKNLFSQINAVKKK